MTLRFENVTVEFGSLRALQNVSVEARPRAITVVIGPNASGKSTLLRAAIGLLRPREGQVMIDQFVVQTASPRELAARAAFVAQRPQVTAPFTVAQVVELGRFALPPDARRVDDALRRMELDELRDRLFQELSVGQQQRVMLARALAQLGGGGTLLLDEPTSAMDLKHVRASMSQLRAAAEAGATVLIALHDLTLAAEIADEAWLLDDGHLVTSGPVDEVLQPGVLAEVFGISFEWVPRPGGGRVLVAHSAA